MSTPAGAMTGTVKMGAGSHRYSRVDRYAPPATGSEDGRIVIDVRAPADMGCVVKRRMDGPGFQYTADTALTSARLIEDARKSSNDGSFGLLLKGIHDQGADRLEARRGERGSTVEIARDGGADAIAVEMGWTYEISRSGPSSAGRHSPQGCRP